jgi:hypothetical protein
MDSGSSSRRRPPDHGIRRSKASNSATSAKRAVGYKLERVADRHKVLQIPPDSSSGRLHAKVFLFQRDDGSRCGIVGSANFTSAGLAANREAAILLESSSQTDQLVLFELGVWFDLTRQDATPIPFNIAKQIFDRSFRREVEPETSIRADGGAWILKSHPGSDEVDYWPRFLAEGVVSIGWKDIAVNPSETEDDDELEKAIREAYPPDPERKHERGYPYIVKVMQDFVNLESGDIVLICRGYPANSRSPVHVFGFAKVLGPFYDDVTSGWWRFKHRAEIQVVDGRLPKEEMARALGRGSLLGTMHSVDRESLYRVAALCKEFLDVPLTL